MYNRVRKLRIDAKASANDSIITVDVDHSEEEATTGEESDEPEVGVLWLKNVIVNDANMPEIIKKLKETVRFRQCMLAAESIDVREMFSFFFTHPILVSFA